MIRSGYNDLSKCKCWKLFRATLNGPKKRFVDELTAFYYILSFSALESLEKAVSLQEEVLDTHDELIHTHQAMSVVLKGLGREEEAEREMELAGECAKRLDSPEVPLEIFQTGEEKGWVVSDSVPIRRRCTMC